MNEEELSGNLFSLNTPEEEQDESIEVEIDAPVEPDNSSQEGEQKAPEVQVNAPDATLKQQIDKQRQRNKNPYKERISNLTNANKNLQAQLQERERQLAIREQELRSRDSLNERLYDSSLSAQEQGIVHQLKAAKEDGDIDTEIKLSQELARVKSEQATFGMYKSQKQQYQPPQQQYEQSQGYDVPDSDFEETEYENSPYAQNPYEVEDIPEARMNFFERNPWADSNSTSFDPELAEEFGRIEKDFKKRLNFNNQTHLIDSDNFYDAIERVMQSQYGLNQEQQEEPVMQQKTYTPQPVSGVSRAGASMADQYAVKTSNAKPVMALTKAEYNIARNLQVPHPSGHGFLSADEAIKKYAENKAYYARQKTHDPRYSVRM